MIFLPQNIIFCSVYITFIPLSVTSDETSFWAVLMHWPSSTSHCLLMLPAGVCGHLQIAAISHTSDVRHSMTSLVTAISGTCNWKIISHGMSPGCAFRSQVRVSISSVKWPLKYLKSAFLFSLEEHLIFSPRILSAICPWFLLSWTLLC